MTEVRLVLVIVSAAVSVVIVVKVERSAEGGADTGGDGRRGRKERFNDAEAPW